MDIDLIRIFESRLCAAKPVCVKEQLAQLPPETADILFTLLKKRVLDADGFHVIPLGIRGLALLVKAQPHLQERLLELLESLPNERCGPWIVRGWEAVITDTSQVARYVSLLEKWRAFGGNDMLSHAARMVLNASRG